MSYQGGGGAVTCFNWLPPSLQWLPACAPAFPVHSDNVHIITEPAEFYCTLKERISSANERVAIASLYLGSGKLEQDLVDSLKQRLQSVPGLSVLWLLDYTRASRQPKSSRHILQPLLEHDNCQVSLFHTPELRGLLKRLLPQRWNEVVALQHMKIYITDDSLLISGANLSSDYFTYRQDRYLLVTNARALCDFLHAVVAAVARYSLLLGEGGEEGEELDPPGGVHPYKDDYAVYCKAVQTGVEQVWNSAIKESKHRLEEMEAQQEQWQLTRETEGRAAGQSDHAASLPPPGRTAETTTLLRSRRNLHSWSGEGEPRPPDTFIFPTLQMPSFNIEHDAALTKRLLSSTTSESHLHLASGYFNLTHDYTDLLLGSAGRCSVLCAHPTANGFLGAAGVAGAIPAAYTQLARQFMSAVISRGQQERVWLWEYRRQGWTFHAKGLWYSETGGDDCRGSTASDITGEAKVGTTASNAGASRTGEAAAALPCLSLIGSPNFGWRSVYRDLENQLVLVTRSPELQERLAAERDRLFRSSDRVTEVTFNSIDRYVKLWVRCIVPVIKRFF